MLANNVCVSLKFLTAVEDAGAGDAQATRVVLKQPFHGSEASPTRSAYFRGGRWEGLLLSEHKQRATAGISARPCGGERRRRVLSLHYGGMTTNKAICQAAFRCALANQEPAANGHVLQQRPEPLCCVTEQRGERRTEMRSKKRGRQERHRGED